ncbi:hypothetical protein LSTR_LSTR004678 [Laodelphax striatellus]|uniref:Secreted protein n=1 Tax=Laodelphax striatellus TaxID=195883 RepID=A0A482WVD1_LAOST|nr:hypothetical protein LSTR_LSTR004678 [Laodelphax striatellus]
MASGQLWMVSGSFGFILTEFYCSACRRGSVPAAASETDCHIRAGCLRCSTVYIQGDRFGNAVCVAGSSVVRRSALVRTQQRQCGGRQGWTDRPTGILA